MKGLARSIVYWPGLDSEIEDLVRNCTKCSSVAKMPVKTTLSSWPQPTKVWSRIHIDYAGPFEGYYYLVVVDALSKWPEVIATDNTTTTATILHLKRLFAQFGNPESLISDNGTNFTSEKFSQFCKESGISHIRTPIYHPMSNGQAERFVDTLKRALLKLKGEGNIKEILQTFLLTYRSSPNFTLPNNATPSEIFLGRKLRTSLELLRPKQKSTFRNSKMEKQFNIHHGARKRFFIIGDLVYARQPRSKSWVPGIILKRRGNVLYDVQIYSKIVTLHANQLRLRINNLHCDNSCQQNLLSLFDTFDLDISPQYVSEPDVRDSPQHVSETDIREEILPQPVEQQVEHLPSSSTEAPKLRRSTRPSRPPARLAYSSKGEVLCGNE